MMIKSVSIASATAASIFLAPVASASGPTVPDQPTGPNGTTAQCYYGTTPQDWTNKNPADCKADYWVWKDGKTILHVNPQKGPGLWGVIKQGYDATNKWCSGNSAACAVVVSSGVAVAQGLLTGGSTPFEAV